MIHGTAEMFFQACGGHVPLRLAVIGENQETGYISFERPYLLIGRSPECDLQLNDPDVSFRHAYVQIVDGRALCVDLASRTGINFRTGSKPMQWLDVEDPVQIGSHVIQLQRSDVLESPTHNSSIIISGTPSDDDRKKLPKVNFELLNRPGMGIVSRQKYWPVRHQVSLIGWSPACKLQLKDSSVSRVHASVVLTISGLWIVNLLGKGGTNVNDKAVRCTQLVDGDEVQIGRFRMRIHVDVGLSARALAHRSDGNAFESSRKPVDTHKPDASPDQDLGVLRSADETQETEKNDLIVDPAVGDDPNTALPGSQRSLIRATQEERSLKTQRELARRPRDRELSAENRAQKKPAQRGLSERFVNDVMDRFVQMQQQTLDHNMQMMMMVTQLFSKMHERQQDMIQNELNRVRDIDKELQEIRAIIVARSQEGKGVAALPHVPTTNEVDGSTAADEIEPLQNSAEDPAVDLPVEETSSLVNSALAVDDENEITVDESAIPVESHLADWEQYDVLEAIEAGNMSSFATNSLQSKGVPESDGESGETRAAENEEDLTPEDEREPVSAMSAKSRVDDAIPVADNTALDEADDAREEPAESDEKSEVRLRNRRLLEEENYPDEFELERRLRMLERERTSRWQRIMDYISGSIPMS